MTALRTLTELASHGKVELLVLLGGNPAFTAPADIPFTSVLAKVPHTVHLGLYDNETSSHVEWYLPQAHPFEAWADGLAHDTTVTLAQPLIEPFYRGRTDTELLSLLIDSEAPSRTLVRETHATLVDTAFRQAVHDGVVADSALDPAEPTLLPLKALDLRPDELGPSVTNGLELEFAADSPVYDGRFANNAWLQELPDSLTKLTWGNAALLSPRTAEQLGIEDGELVTLELQGRRLEVPAMHAPGQARGTVKLSLGYGRRRAGLVGGDVPQGIAPVGSDAYPLRTTKTLYFATGVTLRKTGRKAPVATTQHLHTIDARARHAEGSRLGALVRSATLAEFIGDPGFVENRVHEPPSSDMWAPPVTYEGHRWGLAIDLNRCIGCNACMVACQSENNVPVVGQRNVIKGREMHWLRIDRYYAGDPEDPTVAFQPVACQQCEKAPCEQVCPVGATMHSREGLNDMTYNRCIGTRYCSNNCPYKVRRFNFFNYHIDERQPRERVRLMVYNPEVTVRARGVMEKCTFCVQRIQKAKIVAKNARRPVKDGDIVTACQQACPTDAIVFGDLNDTASRVGRLHGIPRAYALLGELNNQPRVRYLARVRNPNPKLA